MMKEEFEKRIGVTLTPEDGIICEQAYNHPMISDTEGKDQLAALFKTGGMTLMQALAPAGEANLHLSNAILACNQIKAKKMNDVEYEFMTSIQKLTEDYEAKFGSILKLHK